MVMLRRGTGSTTNTYFFTYHGVQFEQSAHIPLQDGDVIQILDFSETPLAKTPISSGSVAVGGYVQHPGRKRPGQLHVLVGSDKGPLELGTAPRPELIAEDAVVLLSRPAADGFGTESYVLPYQEVVSRNGLFRAARARGGNAIATSDTVSVIPIFQVPIIAQSLVADMLRPSADPAITRRLRATYDNSISGRLKETRDVYGKPAVKQIHQFLSPLNPVSQ